MKILPILALGLLTWLPTMALAQQFVPADKPAVLRRYPNASRAEFGYVAVPEDRRNPANTRKIQVAVVVVRAQSTAPKADPVFYIVGGPGGSATLSSAGFPVFEALNATRDIVFVDPRGAGYSLPNLFMRRDALTIGPFVDRNRAFFTGQGIDVTGFNTTEIAQDYEDVRVALGYGPVNLFANSYGTFVAQEMLRRNPDGIRCAVMTGNFPATDSFLPTTLATSRQGFQAFFRDVARDRIARTAYPKLDRRFSALVRRLNRDPLVLETFSLQTGRVDTTTIDGTTLIDETTALLQRTATIRLLPLLISQLERGDLRLAIRFFVPPPTARIENPFGMYLSVLGSDFANPGYAQATSRSVARTSNTAFRETEGPLLIQLARLVVRWGVPFRPGTTRTLPASTVRTLFLNGRMDAQTAASGGAVISQGFSRATNLVYPRIGHAIGFFSGPDLDAALAFIANPDVPPTLQTGRLFRRDFYRVRESAAELRLLERWRDTVVDPPVRADRLFVESPL